MQITMNNHPYAFSSNAFAHPDAKRRYMELAKKVFGLDFGPWLDSGFYDGKFIPYALYDGDLCVSSVGICINDVILEDAKKRYVQISTVMTLPEYRGKGLNRWLMEYVLNEWKDSSDAIYLLGNDSVVDFYPKFGFEEYTEYDFSIPLKKTAGEYRKLNLGDKRDLNILTEKCKAGNPFAALKVDNFSQFMFHCLCFLSDSVYYLKDHDAVVVLEDEGDKLICYDILMDRACGLNEVLGRFVTENTQYAALGFTPKSLDQCTAQESQEEDNHLFVLKGKDNIWKDNRVLFPMLSRA